MKIIFLLCLSLGLNSCINKSSLKNPGLKTLNQYSGEIAHLDVHLATGLAASLQLSKAYEALYEVHPYNSPYELLPSLAKNMPKISKDGRTYTITIKDH